MRTFNKSVRQNVADAANRISMWMGTLFHAEQFDSELDEKMRMHQELRARELRESGVNYEEARYAAQRELGNALRLREEGREAWGWNGLQQFMADVSYAARVLRKSPGFTAVAILTLTLGIGANTAIFSMVNGVLLRPLPYPDPERLVTIESNQSLPDLEDIEKYSQSFEALGANTMQRLDYTGGAEPTQIFAITCNAELFQALGTKPAFGRLITADDDRYGAPGAVVLSHGFWARQFGGDPGVIGKSIPLSGNSYTIVGVLPASFWMPAGGAAGVVVAKAGIRMLLALPPKSLPRLDNIGVDRRVLVFTLGISILTGIVFGLFPAWSASRLTLGEGLKESGNRITGSRKSLRLRRILVVSETVLAILLLVGAGLLIRSFQRMQSVSPGFSSDNLLTMRVELPAARYEEIAKQRAFRTQLLKSLNSLPGVQSAMISELPMSGDSLTSSIAIEGRPEAPSEAPDVQTRTILGDYFSIMGIPLLRGHEFSAQDPEPNPVVIVVNETFVRTYFPNQDPIGARIGWAVEKPISWKTIVGVVGDVKHFGLDQPEEPAVYDLYSQTDQPWKRWMSLVMRSSTDPGELAREAERQIWALDRGIPPTSVLTMKDVMDASVTPRKFNLTLMMIFAGVAIVLAAIGIYGVVAYSVTQRTHEIGIRVALGAHRRDVMRLVLNEGARLAALGTILGLAGAAALTRFMASFLFGIGVRDPLTFLAVGATLILVAAIACCVPARRAMRVDPTVALRYE
jgi:hypothetical protein